MHEVLQKLVVALAAITLFLNGFDDGRSLPSRLYKIQ